MEQILAIAAACTALIRENTDVAIMKNMNASLFSACVDGLLHQSWSVFMLCEGACML